MHIVGEKAPFTLESADVFLFHTPYCKLVQKSLARLMFNDFLSDAEPDYSGLYAGLEKFRFFCHFAEISCTFSFLCVNFCHMMNLLATLLCDTVTLTSLAVLVLLLCGIVILKCS